MHTHMYGHMHTQAHLMVICTLMQMLECTHIVRTHVNTGTGRHTHKHGHIHMRPRGHAGMYAHSFTQTHTHSHSHTHTHDTCKHAFTHLHTATCKHTRAHGATCLYTYAHLQERTCMHNMYTWACPHIITPTPHTLPHGHRHSNMCTLTCVCRHTHVFAHNGTHIYTTVCTHMHIFTRSQRFLHACGHARAHGHRITHTQGHAHARDAQCPGGGLYRAQTTVHECDNLPSSLMPNVPFGVQGVSPSKTSGFFTANTKDSKNVKIHPLFVRRERGAHYQDLSHFFHRG